MERPMAHRPRVLVLEPNPADRELVQDALGRHCDLIFQPNPLYIFDYIEIFEPDLLITELDLPLLSGFELISLMRHEESSCNLPILIFARQTESETQKLAYRLGALHFQAKPCRPLQLFKGAAAFFRLAGGQVPPKRHKFEEVETLITERLQREELHPLLQDAIEAHARQKMPLAPAARRVVAQVANARAI